MISGFHPVIAAKDQVNYGQGGFFPLGSIQAVHAIKAQKNNPEPHYLPAGKYEIEGVQYTLDYPVIITECGHNVALYTPHPLGKGSGNTTVFLGVNITTNELYAVKHQTLGQHIGYARNEAAILKKLDRFIAQLDINSHDIKENGIYTVEKLACGETLEAFRTRNTYQRSDALDNEKLEIAIQFLKELHHLHEKGVFHGDPSLENAMWDGHQLNFIDYQTSILRGDQEKTMAAQEPRSDCYVPPEMIQAMINNAQTYHSRKTEIYSAGIALIELFSEEKMKHQDHIENLKAIHRALVTKNLPKSGVPPFQFGHGIDFIRHPQPNEYLGIQDLFKKMVDMNPDRRPSLPECVSTLQKIQAMKVISNTASQSSTTEENSMVSKIIHNIPSVAIPHESKSELPAHDLVTNHIDKLANILSILKRDINLAKEFQHIIKDAEALMDVLQKYLQSSNMEASKRVLDKVNDLGLQSYVHQLNAFCANHICLVGPLWGYDRLISELKTIFAAPKHGRGSPPPKPR